MSGLREAFPEIARYSMSETRLSRLTIAAVTTVVLGGALLTMDSAAGESGKLLYSTALVLEGLFLLVYGTVRATGSVLNERVERTWEIQRLTPLSSFEMAVGKLLGAPILAYYLAILMLPWVVTGFLLSDQTTLLDFCWHQALLVSAAFFAISLGLLTSSHAGEATSGSSAGTGGGLVGFFALQVLLQFLFDRHPGGPGLRFFGVEWDPKAFVVFSCVAFGLWAFAGAKWRIGKELLERGRPWRLPAFMGFLVLYQTGFPNSNIYYSAVAPAFFAFFSAVLSRESRDHWKRWLTGGDNRGGLTPAWITAAASYAGLAVIVVVFGKTSGWNAEGPEWRYPLMQACFLFRDFAFLQFCRFTASRRPEVMALIFIALMYALPTAVLASFGMKGAFYLCVPYVDPGSGAFLNILPAALQAVAMAVLLRSTVRKQFGI